MDTTSRETLVEIALDGETLLTVRADEPPCSFAVTRKASPESELVFLESGKYHTHGFGELGGWAHFTFRVQAERILRADCFITADEVLDPEALRRGHGSGIRFQPIPLKGYPASPDDLIGGGAFARGLHSRGLITPGWYRLSVECDACHDGFHLQSFHAGMMDVAYMYSESGLYTLVIEPHDLWGLPEFEKMTAGERRKFEDEALPLAPDGTRFRYLNPLRCPHCNDPFFDYQRYPEDRAADYYGHYHFGRKATDWKFAYPETSA